jgi:hypothetical protein
MTIPAGSKDGPPPNAAIAQNDEGTVARPGDFPFVVSVQTKNGKHLCGGVIVDLKTILTAGDSCFEEHGRVQLLHSNFIQSHRRLHYHSHSHCLKYLFYSLVYYLASSYVNDLLRSISQ